MNESKIIFYYALVDMLLMGCSQTMQTVSCTLLLYKTWSHLSAKYPNFMSIIFDKLHSQVPNT